VPGAVLARVGIQLPFGVAAALEVLEDLLACGRALRKRSGSVAAAKLRQRNDVIRWLQCEDHRSHVHALRGHGDQRTAAVRSDRTEYLPLAVPIIWLEQ